MNAAVLDVIYVLLGLCTLLLLLGSGLIFMGFMKYPDLRTGPNFLIIPVQLASILFVFTNTISRLSFAFPKIILGEETCQILRSVMYTMTTLPGMLLAFIGLQRYLIFVKHKTLFSGHLANAVAFLIIFGQNIGTAYFFRFRMQQLKGEYNTTAIDTNSTMYYMISKKSALFRICPYRGQIYSELMPSAAILTLVALKLVVANDSPVFLLHTNLESNEKKRANFEKRETRFHNARQKGHSARIDASQIVDWDFHHLHPLFHPIHGDIRAAGKGKIL